MESKSQTSVNEINRLDFYKSVYQQTTKTKDQLIQLDQFNVVDYIMVDCAGWCYQRHWPNLNIMSLETMNGIEDYQLQTSGIHGIIDTSDYYNIGWPRLKSNHCALIFDHSVCLKYRTVENTIWALTQATIVYQPQIVVFESSTLFVDDCRLNDRISSLSKLLIPGYIVTRFVYDTLTVRVEYKKKLSL